MTKEDGRAESEEIEGVKQGARSESEEIEAVNQERAESEGIEVLDFLI